MRKMGADLFLAALNPAKMAVRTQGDDDVATGATIALEIQAGGKSLKIPGGEAVAMELMVIAFGAHSGPLPRVIFALLKNFLENNANKTYHVDLVFGGATPGCKQGGKFVRTSRPLYFWTQKRTS